MNLLIVSDTSFYCQEEHEGLQVFEPTLREIEALSAQFDTIQWLGYIKGDKKPGHARSPHTDKIALAALPTVRGGKSILSKLKIIPVLPVLTWIIFCSVLKSDVIHSRGPSVPAFICIMISWALRKRVFWHKYAGNWMEPSPPFMYGLQKWLLSRLNHTKVTINGKWPNQPKHIHSLENPCFTKLEWSRAVSVGRNKLFEKPLVLCFVGFVADSKGVPQLMDALSRISNLRSYLMKVIIAGDGPALKQAIIDAKDLSVPVEFTGYLDRTKLNEVYKESHVLILPSRTEGFPKVVAEAAAFGCVPVATDVSSISQYVEDEKSGFLLRDNSPDTISEVLGRLFAHGGLKAISEEAVGMSGDFTYERFANKISKIVS